MPTVGIEKRTDLQGNEVPPAPGDGFYAEQAERRRVDEKWHEHSQFGSLEEVKKVVARVKKEAGTRIVPSEIARVEDGRIVEAFEAVTERMGADVDKLANALQFLIKMIEERESQ